MKIHILGICGTFMASIAALAKQLGHQVRGCDANVYPPMSTQLADLGIELIDGFATEQLDYQPDMILMGNTMKRGMPIVEMILNQQLAYQSAPQWLYDNILNDRWVLAVSGTHGKTTTASMLAWIMDYAGLAPGFLIGGILENFGISARLGQANYFVIEADEYDTAFFDKRSKFVHYHPRSLIINNLEYDHADIFDNLAAIQTQFHHLLRMIPSDGLLVVPNNDDNIDGVLAQGCWTNTQRLGDDWHYRLLAVDGSAFSISHAQQSVEVVWGLIGEHNVRNAIAAVALAHDAGVSLVDAAQALSSFQNTKRRLQIIGIEAGITVYDDFAHHPTAISASLQALRKRVGKRRIIALLELGSYTMKAGIHQQTLAQALQQADQVYLFATPDQAGQLPSAPLPVHSNIDELLRLLLPTLQAEDQVLIMSNRSFSGIYEKLLQQLQTKLC